MVKIVDNFLREDDFKKLKEVVFSGEFTWNWLDGVSFHKDSPNLDDDKRHLSYLVHVLYLGPGSLSPLFNLFTPILEKYRYNFNIKSLVRIKINCYPQSNVLEEHGMHTDYDYEHKGILIYLNNCDGYTRFESGEKIDSVANRVIFFDPSKEHTSTNTTDASRRVTMNFNYF